MRMVERNYMYKMARDRDEDNNTKAVKAIKEEP